MMITRHAQLLRNWTVGHAQRFSSWAGRQTQRVLEHPAAQPAIAAHNWTRVHQTLLQWTFWLSFIAIVGLDLYMVLILKVTSITLRVRAALDEHVTLVAFFWLVGIGIIYLVWPRKVTALVWALLMGHLGTG